MGDIYHGGIGHRFLELGNLDACCNTQGGIQIGKRLIKQIDLGVTDNGATDGDTLALAAGQGFRQAVQIIS